MHIIALSILVSIFQPNTECVFFLRCCSRQKSDHFVMNNFAVASDIHHNTLGRRLNKFCLELISTLNKEQINKERKNK